MTLNLVKILDKKTGTSSYHAVNDLHYNAMLAGGGSYYDDIYSWEWLGDIEISEEVLNEEGLFYKDV